MSKLHAAALVCAIGLWAGLAFEPVLAQTPTADQRSACKQDYEKYCAGTAPGGGRIVACLNKHRDKLAAACQNAIDTRKKSQKPGQSVFQRSTLGLDPWWIPVRVKKTRQNRKLEPVPIPSEQKRL